MHILLGKFLIVFLTAAVMRLPLRVCVLTAVTLCQVGEFSFILLRAGLDRELIAEPLMGRLLGAVILSMLVTPFLIRLGPRLAAGAGRGEKVLRFQTTKIRTGQRAFK